eukprot:gnl/TRDRNA2_/TRDRNA2_40075_c0_seq1.p1 gnl/TRDRNA2_/TRDRNA2_40075_c0~~gnl/TRDRNA2_/TRDRNA2_40075_c0_seq1.p1  ORF type:complete len:315 (+),score=72.68 gnl/TRDRNA2_/TRDRNA2_40075_c0_seq1:109-1053(+)
MGNVDASRWSTLRSAMGMRWCLLVFLSSECRATLQTHATQKALHHKHHHKHHKHHNHTAHMVQIKNELTAASLDDVSAKVEAEVEAGVSAPLGPSLNTTLRLLNQSQHDVLALEASIKEIHERLGGAENVIVDASHNISNVREQIYTLKQASHKNKNYLWELRRYDAKLNGTLDFENLEVGQVGPSLQDTADAAGKMAKAATDAVSPEELEKLRTLNDKLWKATDPTNPLSVDKTEARARKGEKSMEKFEHEMKHHIHSLAVKQLRRGGNKLRKAIRHLDRVAGNEAVDEAARNAGEFSGGLEGLRDPGVVMEA